MKIVVIGGTGLIGSKVVSELSAKGHEAIAASPASGVNTLTGEGLAEVLQGADVLVDLANAPSFDDQVVMDFFTTSTRNIVAAERAAGIKHHVALSIVGTDRLPDSGYMRAKVAQEGLIKGGGVPYTILRSTQFFEFLKGIANNASEGDTVRMPIGLVQPVAAVDLSAAVADIAVAAPVNRTPEIAGPEAFPLSELVERYLAAAGDKRIVNADAHAKYFGSELAERSLVPQGDYHQTPIGYETWIKTAFMPRA